MSPGQSEIQAPWAFAIGDAAVVSSISQTLRQTPPSFSHLPPRRLQPGATPCRGRGPGRGVRHRRAVM